MENKTKAKVVHKSDRHLRDPSVPIRPPHTPRGIRAPTTFASPDDDGTRFRPPTKYSAGLARKICERIMAKESLTTISKDPAMPSMKAMVNWLAHPALVEFREMYYYARRVQAEMLVDEMIDIADDTENDWQEVFNRNGESKGFKPDNEAIQRSRVRIDTRKWLAAKMIPKMYGERVEHGLEVSGDLADLLKKASNQDRGLPNEKIVKEVPDGDS